MAADLTVEKQKSHLFQPGQSGNPGGRPKGARSKLGEEFLKALLADFSEHGKQAIIDMREKDVTAYCKTVASILPKEIDAGEQTLSILAEIFNRIDGRTRAIVPVDAEARRLSVQ